MCTSPITIKNPYFSVNTRDKARELQKLGHGASYKELMLLRGSYIDVPCGRCCECARSRSNEWFLRLLFHAKKYDPKEISFVTLTYNNGFVPTTSEYLDTDTGELSSVTTLFKPHFQLFMKRLRMSWECDNNPSLNPRSSTDRKNESFVKCPVTYFACGELGSHTFRGHMHAILFGLSPSDALRYSIKSWVIRSRSHYSLAESDLVPNVSPKTKRSNVMDSVPLGRVYVSPRPAGDGSLHYVAKYCTKYKCKFKDFDDIVKLHTLIDSIPSITGVERELLRQNIFYEYEHKDYEHFVPPFRLCSQGIGSNIVDYPEYYQFCLDTLTGASVIDPHIVIKGHDNFGNAREFSYSMPRYMRSKLYSQEDLDFYSLNLFKHRQIQFQLDFVDYVNSIKKTQFTDYNQTTSLSDFPVLLCDFESLRLQDSEERERKSLVSFLKDLSNDLSDHFEY